MALRERRTVRMVHLSLRPLGAAERRRMVLGSRAPVRPGVGSVAPRGRLRRLVPAAAGAVTGRAGRGDRPTQPVRLLLRGGSVLPGAAPPRAFPADDAQRLADRG